jgi:hypothetical protein
MLQTVELPMQSPMENTLKMTKLIRKLGVADKEK